MKRFLVLLSVCLALAACGGGGGGLGPPLKTYTVTFDTNGGTPVAPLTVSEGYTISPLPVTAKEDFDLDGWFKDTGLSSQWNLAGDVVTSNITLYAKWKEQEGKTYYDIDFITKDGELVRTDRIASGKTLNRPLDPVREGNLFFGWYKDMSLTNDWDFGTDTVTANITLYGVFIDSAYTVTFDGNGGTVTPGSRTVNYGNTVAGPTSVSNSGYKLAGWLNGYIPWDFANNTVTTNVTLKAWWGSDAYNYPFEYTNTASYNSYLDSFKLGLDPGPCYLPISGFLRSSSMISGTYINVLLEAIEDAEVDVILDLSSASLESFIAILPHNDLTIEMNYVVALILPDTEDASVNMITESLGRYSSLKVFYGRSINYITASGAFSGCTDLEQVYLPQIEDLGGGTFENTGTNPLVITMGSVAPSVGGSLFNAARLVTVRIPYGATGYGPTWQAAFTSGGITLSFEHY